MSDEEKYQLKQGWFWSNASQNRSLILFSLVLVFNLTLHRNMPVLSVIKSQLFSRLGKSYTDEEFVNLCFDFGIELDDIVDLSATGEQNGKSSKKSPSDDQIEYKIDIPANRYDSFSISFSL